jgi:hypothetical protein
MEFDVLLDTFGARWADLRDTARIAIDAGFGGIWIYDHLDGRVYDAPFVLECWTVLSSLATEVPRGVLGSLVLNVGNRHPGLLATMSATLQETSGGRVMLGIGAGGGDARYVREQVGIGRTVPADQCDAPRSRHASLKCDTSGAVRDIWSPILIRRSSSEGSDRKWPSWPVASATA